MPDRKALWILISSLLLVFCIIGALLGSFFYFKKVALAPLNIKSGTVIEIKEGNTIADVSNLLVKQGILPEKNKKVFTVVYRYLNKEANTGFYELTPDMSMVDVIEKIDSKDFKLVKITIPEGWRNEQIAKRLSENGIVDYQDFLNESRGNEGKLFPDTYYLNPKMEAAELVEIMTEDFDSRTKNLNLTREDLIIASIVEREAINDTERTLIAGIYKNRIKRNMKLEADPTVQYGKDNNLIASIKTTEKIEFKFWKPIKLVDYLAVKSEYNTYLIPSLPPGPICNPGLASIKAAINYQQHDYLYFLQNDGKIYPAKTLSEHNANRVKVLGAKL